MIIGDNITIRLLDIYKDTNQIRLGIEAPKDMVIDRKAVRELRERRIKDVLGKHTI